MPFAYTKEDLVASNLVILYRLCLTRRLFGLFLLLRESFIEGRCAVLLFSRYSLESFNKYKKVYTPSRLYSSSLAFLVILVELSYAHVSPFVIMKPYHFHFTSKSYTSQAAWWYVGVLCKHRSILQKL